MSTVAVKDLRDNIDALLRRVQDDGETIEIAVEGRIVAHLIPSPPQPVSEDEQAARDATDLETWRRLMRLGDEIGRTWPADVSAVDAIRDVRREL